MIIDLKDFVNDPRVEKILTALCYGAIRLNKEISLSDTGGGHRPVSYTHLTLPTTVFV